MHFQTLTLSLLLVATFATALPLDGNELLAEDKEFCYTDPDCDPDSQLWTGVCHTGAQQSPIALPRFPSPVQPGVGSHLHVNAYRAPAFRLRNNGHSVQLELLHGNDQPTVGISHNGVNDSGEYVLESAHFHWGADDNSGSEHIFDNERFSMELHLVHYRREYGSTAAALNTSDPNALTVIGLFLDVAPVPVPPNPFLQPIVQNLKGVEHPANEWVVVNHSLDLVPFLPPLLGHMHNYHGSLTTPNCDEQVNWLVHDKPVPISRDDVKQFRELEDGNGRILAENHRPVQPLNGRAVYLIPTTSS